LTLRSREGELAVSLRCLKTTHRAALAEPNSAANDFLQSDEGLERMDAICMVLVATGEAVRRLDRETDGSLFALKPGYSRSGVPAC
jgi:hypothetical protein